MLMTTTSTLDGMPIQRYLGVVSGEAILGANIMKDLFASVRDIVGGRSGAYEAELIRAKETALREMESNAAAMGANAIIGIDLDYETLGSGNSMLMVCVSGTAVIVNQAGRTA
ncbi:MAG TPA: heavy metal-binding domain-containing protein [Thermomicrobiales bacterium]|nr:heavy metal-binding domain-containing protein [Thermomicrobiales bacterium]